MTYEEMELTSKEGKESQWEDILRLETSHPKESAGRSGVRELNEERGKSSTRVQLRLRGAKVHVGCGKAVPISSLT